MMRSVPNPLPVLVLTFNLLGLAALAVENDSGMPSPAVRVEIFEDVPGLVTWDFETGAPVQRYTEPAMAFATLPVAYNHRGVRADRSNPFLLRATLVKTLPKGEHRFLLRSLQSARLSVDGHVVATTPFIEPGGDGHGLVPPSPATLPRGLRFIRAGHHDQFVTVESSGKPQVYVLEAIVGGEKLRPEVGELSVSVADGQGRFHLFGPSDSPRPHDDATWLAYTARQAERLEMTNRRRRREAAVAEDAYWNERHRLARAMVARSQAPTIPRVKNGGGLSHPIDRYLAARQVEAGVEPASVIGDLAFLRRLSLDARGVIPSPSEIRDFLDDPPKDRRARAIDRFLEDSRWADHWVGYWQDVLAENPGILKPTLNNTGPFRYWIHESFLDNKPMDRFVTELIRMEGSVYFGGPAGFRLATQNDAPMADRAQIVAQAFLAMNLACARCHDAPYHEFEQRDLFSLAAMLKKEPQEVPPTSSIPADAGIKVGRLVNVTLKPGEQVEPRWPFDSPRAGELAAAHLGELDDSRERLAALITDPTNSRFPKVVVNRLWKRYFGRGLVEPVDDWENARPSHPTLLNWLAREFVLHSYDLKYVARLIFTSLAYQREAGRQVPRSEEPKDRLFASPERRRMTAEQLVDSLFRAVGKDMRAELLTLDNDSRRPPSSFLNLGYPDRAWQFTSLSNDRDRPALSMPRTQEIVDVLAMFGWRESRQSARSARDHEPNVLQPAILANGRLGNGRVARLTDRCELTDLCVATDQLPVLIAEVSLRVLNRPPTHEEMALFAGYLEPGFADRIRRHGTNDESAPYDRSLLLSWSNHLNAEATELMMAKEARESLGDPPTERLEPAWRERMEDVVWAMINSPEFVFVP